MRIAVLSRIVGLAARLSAADLAPLVATDVSSNGSLSEAPTITFHASATDAALEVLAAAEVVLADPPILIDALSKLSSPPTNLRWVQSTFAGVNQLMTSDSPRGYCLTRLAGVFGPHMAEYCLAHIVERERSFGAFRRAQEQAMWSPAEDYSYRTLGELRIGILGLGDIGAHVAATLRSCGCTDVHALVRRPRSSTSSSCGDSSRSGDSGRSSSSSAAGGSNTRHDSGSGGDGTSGGGAGVTLHGALPSLLRARCDYLINTLPSTRATSGLLDGDTLAAACAPGGSAQQHQQLQQRAPVLINVGRGDVASEAALLRALDAGWLSGAVLDVLPAEPLPRSSPLWRARGVTITPHVAAKSTAADVARVFRENLRRHARGQPLLYTVDWDQGY